MDPAYGLQLHHPRFQEYVGAPELARLLTWGPRHWVQTMDREEAVTAALQLQHDAGLITTRPVCHVVEPHVIRGDEARFREGGISIGHSGSYSTGASDSLNRSLYGRNGFVATAGWPGYSRAIADLVMQQLYAVHRLPSGTY